MVDSVKLVRKDRSESTTTISVGGITVERKMVDGRCGPMWSLTDGRWSLQIDTETMGRLHGAMVDAEKELKR